MTDPAMPNIIRFTDEGSTSHPAVGGKAVNLGKLTVAGFNVPTGFTVTTGAYRQFVDDVALQDTVKGLLASVSYDRADEVEAATSQIRKALMDSDMPDEVVADIRAAHEDLTATGSSAFFAVRSSGTAEDLEGASFAGMHDTYLDITGIEEVLDAIKRCWASLWTARATAYRESRGFGHLEAGLAVVVQKMVPAEVAGVMFTAHPLTGAVDKTVINASWGLGEAVVSGITTPDQFVLDRSTLKVVTKELGSKETQVVRDPENGRGTVVEKTPATQRAQFSLTDAQASELALLGRKVMEYYEGLPQDMEWAYAEGRFYLLQARPVTGVSFSWDEDLEYWQYQNEPGDCIYTRAWADEYWNGAITPLHYSYRAKELSDCHYTAQMLYGNPDLARKRTWKYHKGEAYFASSVEREWISRAVPPTLRNAGSLNKLPPSWWEESISESFSWTDYARVYARIKAIDDRSAPYKFYKVFNDRIFNRRQEANGLGNEALASLSDRELHSHVLDRLEIFKQADDDLWAAFFLYAPFALGLLGDLLGRWYDGDPVWAFADLCSGLDEQTITLQENYELWSLGEKLRNSDELRGLIDKFEGAEFFAELEKYEDGRNFLAEYQPWLAKRGHRGHADRDSWFPRRADDPMIDYNSFRAILSSPSEDPRAMEESLRAKRKDREADVHASIRRQPLGTIKLQLFKLVHDYSLRFLAFRDNEREYLDNLTYTQRRCFLELGRRMLDRGLIAERDDVWFLGVEENFDVLFGKSGQKLARAKVDARKDNFLRFLARDVRLPNYLNPDGTVALPGELIGAVSDADTSSGSVLGGSGMSQGTVTGRARVIKSLGEIGSLERGDILICNSTDPGWTPVFLIISGLVLESGGMLSHGACLSREYGLPAITSPDAMTRIPDGATITLDGGMGLITIQQEEPVAELTAQ